MNRVKPSPNLKKITLLYVEDEIDIREAFEFLVKRFFKNIYIASNGKEGLDIFKEKQEEIDIIISDIKMPIMTGLEMAREIKNIKNEVPIIFTTAFGDNEYLKEAIDVGVDGYIIKPIDRNKLFERLNFIANSIVIKKEMEEYLQLVEILFNYQRDGLLLLDEDFKVKIYNKTFENILKFASIDKVDSIEDLITYCYTTDGDKIDKELFMKSLNKKIVCKSEKTNKYFDIDIKKIKDYILVNIEDITDLYIQTEKIQDSAMRDALTNLYNRQKLKHIEKDLIDTHLCIIIFDIDNFKKINDTYGHLKGDEVLQKLAESITGHVRSSDVVIRWGGEEFIVILKDLKQISIARNLAEKLRINIEKIEIEEVGHFSCSFGVACGFIEKQSDINAVLENADEALYIAKKNGKNRVEVSIR